MSEKWLRGDFGGGTSDMISWVREYLTTWGTGKYIILSKKIEWEWCQCAGCNLSSRQIYFAKGRVQLDRDKGGKWI